MSTSSFTAGAVVEIDRRPYIMVRMIGPRKWQLEDCRTRQIVEHSIVELQELYKGRRLIFIKELGQRGTAAPRAIVEHIPEDAKVRRAYVHATLDLPCTESLMRAAIEEVWRKIKRPEVAPNPVTVIRWRKRYLESGRNVVSLITNQDARGNRKPRFPDEVNRIVDDTIELKYLTQERNTITATFEKALLAVKAENKLRHAELQLPLPTWKLVKGRITRIPAYERHVARHGKTAADVKFRAVLGHRTTKLPLERAEIDHTPLDLLVVDDETFVPLGRPYLTSCIDDNSRSILGIYIAFQPPSYISVARCLKHAFMPKPNLHTDYPAVKNEWEQHGVMRELVVDNGAEFHSEALDLACGTLGIELHYAPRKSGAFKGKIERFQGTLNRSLSHSAPGTTFSNIFEREDYDPVKHAVIRYSKLKELIHVWIVDYYHQKPHRGLNGATPSIAWTSSLDSAEIPLPDNPAQLDVILGRPESRRLSHSGIELDSLFYNSPGLVELRRQHGDTLDVDIRIDDQDIGRIYILSPDHTQVIEAKALKFEYANGLTRWQHKICKRFARRHLERDDPDAWLDAKERISSIIAEELGAKRAKRKKLPTQAARFIENGPLHSRTKPAAAKTEEIEVMPQIVRAQNPPLEIYNQHVFSESQNTNPVQASQAPKKRKKFEPIHRDRSEPIEKDD